MLTANDILALSRSGYSAAQIELIGKSMISSDNDRNSVSPPSPSPAPEPAPAPAAPAPEPAPAPAAPAPEPAPAPAAPAAPAPAPAAQPSASGETALAGILAALNELKTTMQASNLATATQPANITPSAEDLLTAMVIPPQRKEK